MVDKEITAKIHFCAIHELPEAEKMLVDLAKETALKAYAPYSLFRVGVALLLDNGQVVTGNNQENAAYPSGMCAERVALFYANANWPELPVTCMAIAATSVEGFTARPIAPCGSCRQVLLETETRFETPIRLLLYGEDTICRVDSAADLLPLSFDNSFLP
jgi:cytidine deaminase